MKKKIDWNGFKENVETYLEHHSGISANVLKTLFDNYSENIAIIKSTYDDDDDLNMGDALDNCGSVSNWENKNGRGFWGNPTSGYIYDDDENGVNF